MVNLFVRIVFSVSLFCFAPLLDHNVVKAQSVDRSQSCEISDDDANALLALDYTSFDQTLDRGWRPIADNGCLGLAAQVIENYISRYENALQASEFRILHWHAGQLKALSGAEKNALLNFEKAYNLERSTLGNPVDWNSYVDATIAFIEKDEKGLEAAISNLKKQELTPNTDPATLPNLNITEGLLKCLKKSYAVAYQSCR